VFVLDPLFPSRSGPRSEADPADLVFFAAVGWGTVSLTEPKDGNAEERFPWLLWFPLGFALVATVWFVVIRILIVAKQPGLAVATGLGVLAGTAVIGGAS
jgi:hypothetical protein